MTSRTLQHRLEHAAYVVASRLLLALPHRFARRLGHAAGRLFGAVVRRRRRQTLENLERVLPELDHGQRERILRACFAHYGATFFETVSAARFGRDEVAARFDVVGWEHLDALEARGKGYFLLTGHYGAWDLATYPLGRRLGELHLVARPLSNPLVWRDVERVRERWGNVLIPKRRAGHKMLNAVRRGGRVALMIDQRVRPRDGILVPFLGRPAWTSPVLAYLSIYTGAPVVPLFCVPAPGGRYRLTIEEPIWPEGRGEAAEEALTRRYLATVEAKIRERPELWMWMHSRWRLTAPVVGDDERQRLRRDAGLPPDPRDERERGGAEDAGELAALTTTAALERSEQAWLAGPAERVATLAAAAGHALIDAGHAVRWAPAAELADELRAAAENGELAKVWRRLDQLALLIVDDRDGVYSGGSDPGDAGAVAALLAQRRERRATLVLARRPPPDPAHWDHVVEADR